MKSIADRLLETAPMMTHGHDTALFIEAAAELRRLSKIEGEVEALRGKYNELIMSVGNKYHNETRHETALRYIRKAETTDGVAALAARPGEEV